MRAARLWGAEEALLEKIEAAVYTYVPDRSLHRSRVAAARSRLGEEAFEAAWAEGRTMTPEQAVEYALDHSATSGDRRPRDLPRRAQRPRGRGAAPGRRWADQRRGRGEALPQLPHRRLAPGLDLPQVGIALAHRGDPLCRRTRPPLTAVFPSAVSFSSFGTQHFGFRSS